MKTCTSKYHNGTQQIDESEFGTDNRRNDGLHNHCKKCRYEATKAHTASVKARTGRTPAMRRYYANHEENKKKNKLRLRLWKLKRYGEQLSFDFEEKEE